MTRTKGMWVLVLSALLAGPALGAQLLQNTSFESGTLGVGPDNWTLSSLADVNYCEGTVYEMDPHTGNRYLMNPSNWNSDIGTAEQSVGLAAGTYHLALSFWARVDDDSAFPSSVTGEIIVDGEVVAAAALDSSAVGFHDGPEDYYNIFASWSGQVNSTVTVRLTLIGDGAGGWGNAAVDDVELSTSACGASQERITDISPNVVDYRPVPAEATVSITGVGVADGDQVQIDAAGTNRKYEFDTNGSLQNGGNVTVNVAGNTTAANARAQLITAINGDAPAPCTAAAAGGDVIRLTWETPAGHGAANYNTYDANNTITVSWFWMTRVATDPSVVTISDAGGHFDATTTARLWQAGPGSDGYEIPGTVTAWTPTSLTVEFPTKGVQPSKYDVIVQKTGCNPDVVTQGFDIRDANAAVNLLVNGGFSVPYIDGTKRNDVGNAQMWFGDYRHDPALTPTPKYIDCASDYTDSCVWEVWSSSKGEPGAESSVTWQTVAVAAGTVNFEGYLCCNAQGDSTSTMTLTLYDGGPGDTVIATTTIDDTTTGNYPTPGGDWTKVTMSGATSSGYVTVEFTTYIYCDGWSGEVSSVWADAFKVTSSVVCPGVEHAMFAYPTQNSYYHDENIQVTIRGGVNLDDPSLQVSMVYVDKADTYDPKTNGVDEPESVVTGAINSQSPTQVTVTFPTASATEPVGLHNILVEASSCLSPNLDMTRLVRSRTGGSEFFRYQPPVPAMFVDAIETVCRTPTTIADSTPIVDVASEGDVDITVSGLNASLLSSARLVAIGQDWMYEIHYDARKPPTVASVTIDGDVADGDTIETDITGVNRVFEFSTDATLQNGGDVRVDVSGGLGAGNACFQLATAINADHGAGNVPFGSFLPGGNAVTLLWDPWRPGGPGAQNTNQNDANAVITVTGFTQPRWQLDSTARQVVGGSVKFTFSMANALGGMYKLVAYRNDGCESVEWDEAFRYVPPSGNVLLNGDFESQGPMSNNTPIDWPSRVIYGAPAAEPPPYDEGKGYKWYKTTDSTPGLTLKYNGNVHNPGASPDGGNWASVDQGSTTASTAKNRQIVPVIPGSLLTLKGYIAAGIQYFGCGPHRHRVILYDGFASEGHILGEFHVDTSLATQFVGWTQFSLTGMSATQSHVTIEWGHVPNPGGGGGGIVATHVDGLQLLVAARECNDPFADTDGDHDVDQEDFAVFQVCHNGSDVMYPADPAYCACLDHDLSGDHDGDVDSADLLAFEACASGPNVAADTGCDD